VGTNEECGYFYDELRAFALSRIHSEALADDIVQDAFLRAHRQSVAGERVENPRAWLYRVVRNLISDLLRKIERSRSLEERLVVEPSESPVPNAQGIDAEIFPLVARVLPLFIGSLADPYKEALRLVDLEGHSVAEAADQVGVTLACMKARVRRGREQLLGALKECCAFEVDGRGRIVEMQRRTTGPCACSG
jgi:RNA polymerase sigma-70 factor (ECF subfamily)